MSATFLCSLLISANKLSGTNGSESLCRDGTKTRWRLQWMYQQSYGDYSTKNGFYTLLNTYLSFLRAALADKNVYIARNQCQVSKPGARQNLIFIIFSSFLLFQSGQCYNRCSDDDQSHTKRKELLVIGAFCTSIITKQKVLRSVSVHSKVQAPSWTPFCYCIITIIA